MENIRTVRKVLPPKDFRTQWKLLGPEDRSEVRRYVLRAQPHPEVSKAALIVGFSEWQLSRWWLVPAGLLYAVGLHLLGAALGMCSPIGFGMPGIWIGVVLWLIARWVRAARVNRAIVDRELQKSLPQSCGWADVFGRSC